MIGKGRGKRPVRPVGLGHDHDAARVLVQPVDDSRPADAADARQAVAAMVDQGVDQRAGPIAGRRVDDQAGRLVDHDQLVVLEEDVQCDRLTHRCGGFGWRQLDGDRFASGQPAAGLGHRPAADPDRSAAYQRLNAASRKAFAEGAGQPLVEAAAAGIPGGGQLFQSGTGFAIRGAHRSSAVFMARPTDDDLDDKPLDPALERVRRKLLRFVVVNLGILLAALMVVAAALVYKSSRPPLPQPAAPAAATPQSEEAMLNGAVPLPPGARLVSQSLSGNRLALDTELADGRRVLVVYDLAEKRIVGQLTITAP